MATCQCAAATQRPFGKRPSRCLNSRPARAHDCWWKNEAAQPIAFVLEPRLYQRRWFLPLCAALAVGLGWVAYRGLNALGRVQRQPEDAPAP